MLGTLVRALAIAGLSWVLFAAPPAGAQPTRDRILGDITIAEGPGCAVIRIGFSFPIRYLRHFPYDGGDELRIRMEPISISAADESALAGRESAKAPPNDFAGLLQVVFEGDIETGPYLTLFFAHPVAYQVKRGADFRSLTITVEGPEPSDSCIPAR
jgi:hypothetical protein